MLPGAMVDRITFHSYAREPVAFDLELRVDADFRPMLEVRGLVAPTSREVRRHARGHTLRLSAVGLDGRERSTLVTCSGAAATEGGRLCFLLELDPGEEHTLTVRFELSQPDGPTLPPAVGGEPPAEHASVSSAGAEADAWLADRPQVELDAELVDRVLRRSLLDLRLLASELDGHRYYAAGVPWYATLFGRDSIIAALQVLAFDRAMAEETLRLLAGRLGTKVDDEHDEEPGKVLHELRRGRARRPATDAAGAVLRHG